jgi:hypothetical protein
VALLVVGDCIDNDVPTVTVRTYPNQKPWITGNIRIELKARAAAFKEQETNPDAYKKSRYALRQTIKQIRMWRGLNYYGLQRETQT